MNDGTINLTKKALSPPLVVAANAEDVVYRNLYDPKHPHASKWKSLAEALLDEYRPFADKHFLIEVRRDFYSRFWGMYLACALHRNALKHAYSLFCPKPARHSH